MGTLVHDCPHCNSAKMAFVIVGVRSLPLSSDVATNRRVTVGLQCQQCFRGAAATLRRPPLTTASEFASYHVPPLMKEGTSVPDESWHLDDFWPKPTPLRVPEYLPEAVERAFIQGGTNLALPDHEEAAATMFRRSLDLALKVKFPDMKGDLNAKIKKLADGHVLPQSLVDWAHQVRVIGNDGAHDLDGCDQADATAARDFVDAVLRYLFSLPGMIDARRPVDLLSTSAEPAEGG